MTAYELIAQIRGYGGFVGIVDGRPTLKASPSDAERVRLNAVQVREALEFPERYPCRHFDSHPTTPTRPCRRCGKPWSAHPPELLVGHGWK